VVWPANPKIFYYLAHYRKYWPTPDKKQHDLACCFLLLWCKALGQSKPSSVPCFFTPLKSWPLIEVLLLPPQIVFLALETWHCSVDLGDPESTMASQPVGICASPFSTQITATATGPLSLLNCRNLQFLCVYNISEQPWSLEMSRRTILRIVNNF
jgi:hypothetical protein